ncbi:HNH endonuclease [Streptomyces sp. NPDC020983]|uniref:HNH endonuclease n=1 Tax=Streptomyces sp. NPDC020983 TaxID=3365106 RepID=UPI0037B17556
MLVDVETYERLNGRAVSVGSHGYAQIWDKPHMKTVHRWLMNVQPGANNGVIVDHINRNRLDCRRSNLRLTTPTGNNLNRTPTPRELPLGVYLTRSGRYAARLKRHRVKHNLGTYDTPEQAASAVEAARVRLDVDAFLPAA